MDISAHRIRDNEFWARPSRESDRLAGVLVGQFEGVLVDAPRRIPIDRRSTFPMGVYRMGPIRQVATLPFAQHGVIVAVDLTHNRLYAASADSFNQDSDPIRPRNPANEAASYPDGDTCQTHSLELRNVLHLPWRPAKFMVMALIRSQVSNRASVELVGVAAKNEPTPAQSNSEPPLIRIGRFADAPAIPEQPAIALALSNRIDVRNDGPWLVRGAFRLKADVPGPHSPGGASPDAIVTIHLLVTGNDGWLNSFAIRVPGSPAKGGLITGRFAVDLRKLPGAPNTQQTYFVYAFSGTSMAGPVVSVAAP
jgi:hypothetical protein